MSNTTRTLGPLHFEDLEPKRFEDLARQLVYDFKPWRRLEATGRAGADDGFDARGYEIVNTATSAATTAEEDEDAALSTGLDDRLWLVQCKRERAIGPTKLLAYLDDIQLAEGEKLYGIVFTAACDFSKTARDRFRDKCRALGIQEWHLWGKAELEDKLMRPENDGLLFAYFGISLTIRRRTVRADLRAKLAMKRKAYRMLGDKVHASLLLRSPDAATYPDPADVPDFKNAPIWIVRHLSGMAYGGIKFRLSRYFAYLSDDGTEWDAAFGYNDGKPSGHEDPWAEESPQDSEIRQQIWQFWNDLPEKNRAWLVREGLVPFEAVLDIDEHGDEFIKQPHVYVQFEPERGPFRGFYETLTTAPFGAGRWDERHREDGATRISIFPPGLREPKATS